MKLNKEGLPEFEHEHNVMDRMYILDANNILHTWIKENCKVVYSNHQVWFQQKDLGNYTNKAYLLPPIPIKECEHRPGTVFDGSKIGFTEICLDCNKRIRPVGG